MKRREFLKYAGLLGAGSVLPLAPSMQLFAAQDNYTGPLWITIEARGGWDPTSFCDPKGYSALNNPNDPDAPKRINNYPSSGIIDIPRDINSPNDVAFRVAPPPDRFLLGGDLYYKYITNPVKKLQYSAEQFFKDYQSKLLVINGIDVKTLAHGDGQRNTWSGELGRGGFPNFGALVSGTLASTRPIPFLTNGGYSDGGGLVTPVRINTSGQAALAEIAYPNRSASSATSPSYFSSEVVDLIQQASAARLDDLDNAQYLPRIKAALSKLKTSRVTNVALQDFVDNLNSTELRPANTFRSYKSYQMYFQGSVALSAYATGATAAAHISLSSFDTHSLHDENHHIRLMDLFEGIDAIVKEAEVRNLSDRIVVVIGSDFGRTNKYNTNASPGKNHWPITSMMFMGNNTQVIRGNRVIGSTDSLHKANTIDPVTLQDLAADNPNGVRITPAHIHRALRRLAGVDTSSAASSDFPLLTNEDIDFFS